MELYGLKAKVQSKTFVATTDGMNLFRILLTAKTENGFVLNTYKYAFMDKHGKKFIIKNFFEYANPFKNGLSVVYNKGKVGIINKKGNFVLEPIYDRIVTNGNLEKKNYDEFDMSEKDKNIFYAINIFVHSHGKIHAQKNGDWKEISLLSNKDFTPNY